MSEHPSDTTLFECATRDDASVRAHLRGCDACAKRFTRLRGGASIIDAVRHDSAPDVDWRSMDARILPAAESAASDIRRGSLRAPRRIHAPVYIGIALAAAAAGVFMLRTRPRVDAPTTEIAHVSPAQQPRANAIARVGAAPVESLTATVLLLAAPVSYAAAGGESMPMNATTQVRQGGRISADDHGGRAIVALRDGVRVDARAGTDLTLARFSSTETTLELAKGEARIDGPARESGRIALEARGWTLLAKGGGFIAKIDGDVVRLRVMSGKVGVSREGVAERDANAGEDIELAATGNFRVLSHEARDSNEIDDSLLADDGQPVTVPRLSDRAAVTVAGHGTLPSGISMLRVRSSITLQSQSGDESWSLLLDPNVATDSVSWRRTSRLAVLRPAGAQGNTESARASELPMEVTAPVEVAPPPVAPAVPVVEPVALPRYSVRNAPGILGSWREYTANVSEAVASCIGRCATSGNCPTAPSISIHVEPNANGSAFVRVSGISEGISACVRSGVEAITVPSGYRGQGQLVTLSRE